MKISVISPTDLGQSERTRWRELQRSSPVLGSPCFSWEFTAAAGAARDDVRIAVLEEDDRIVGFFPHQQRWGMGAPVGGRLADHQGVIATPGTRFDWDELLVGAKLSYWQFDHLSAWQRPHVAVRHATSPGLDLSRGFAHYQQRRNQTSSVLAKLSRAARKMAKDLGPLRFEADCRGDTALFQQVLAMKSAQCLRSGEKDLFALGWTRTLVEHVHAAQDPCFAGSLSALYAGDHLVAAHFGMRTPTVWHWWFPVYCREHAAHSPGLLLLVHLAEHAASQGHSLLDLGKGDEAYKSRFADSHAPLLEGIVCRPTPVTLARQVRKSMGAWVRSSPFAQQLRPLMREGSRATVIGAT